MHVLDTDMLTHFHLGHPAVVNRVEHAADNGVAITVITAIETIRGRHEFLVKAADGRELLRAEHYLQETESLLNSISILRFGANGAAEFDRLRQNKKLKKIGRPDLLIACITLAHKAVLVTRNERHFSQVPGLQIENWLA